MADAPKKGSGLGKKVGPLPLWAWVLGGLALAYLAYRFISGQSGSSGAAQQTQTVASQTPDQAAGLMPSAGAPASTGSNDQTAADLVTALGGQQTSLLSALEARNQDIVALAESQITAAQSNPAISPSSTSETQGVLGSQPGGPNAPNIYYVSLQAVAPLSSKPAAASSNVVPLTRTTAATRYFTYKRDVPLAGGQTVHFLSGRGYYAA